MLVAKSMLSRLKEIRTIANHAWQCARTFEHSVRDASNINSQVDISNCKRLKAQSNNLLAINLTNKNACSTRYNPKNLCLYLRSSTYSVCPGTNKQMRKPSSSKRQANNGCCGFKNRAFKGRNSFGSNYLMGLKKTPFVSNHLQRRVKKSIPP